MTEYQILTVCHTKFSIQIRISDFSLLSFAPFLRQSGTKVNVCYHSATQSSQFDVSFHKKLLKFVAARGKIFSLKFTKYRLAAGFRPDPMPMGELKRSPRPPSRNKRGLLLRGGEGGEGKGEGRGGGEGSGGEGKEGEGPTFSLVYATPLPNLVFKVVPFFDTDYLTNGYRHGHS